MSRRCWCGRPVATDVVDAYECAEHDNVPRRREGSSNLGLGAAICLALVCFAVAIGILAAAFDDRYEIQPSPEGPVVVERTR